MSDKELTIVQLKLLKEKLDKRDEWASSIIVQNAIDLLSIPIEPPVMQKIAGIKKEYENLIGKQLGSDDKDDWDKVIYIDFEGLWNWIEEKLKSNFSA